MSSIKYRPYVDGLRAFAVIPVLLFHLGFDWIPGGFLGVDVFFVISGFLITSIILKESYQGTFTFQNFWLRRVRRILPVLSVVLMCTLFASYFIAFRPDMNAFGKDSLSASFSFANINMWLRTGDYWGTLAESSPFLHTWSLSVEEQFYIFFPVLLVVLLRFGRRFVFPAIVCVTMVSFALFLYAAEHSPTACFYLLPMRAWELAAGCLLAIFLRHNEWSARGLAAHFGAWLGLISVLASYFLISGEAGISALTVFSVVGSVLIILFADNDGTVNRILSHSWTVYIGKISYSLYLWHWPVFVLGKSYSHSRFSDEPS
jgi:peptidoglycan/LPS O-acetylase OafA/YrhL